MTDLTPVVIDYETFYSPDFSLRKLPTALYVRDPRFHVHGVGIKVGSTPTQWYSGDNIRVALGAIDWTNTLLVGHNLRFDGLITNEIYGHRPARYADTMGLAKAFLPTGIPADLDSVANFLGFGGKKQGVLSNIKGVKDLTPEQERETAEYCVQDVDLTRKIFEKLWPLLPESERYLLHVVMRMGIEPLIQLDADILDGVAQKVTEERETVLAASGVPLSTLSSNQQFFAYLATLVPDEDLPRKPNAKGEIIPALGKSDQAWAALKAKYPELGHIFEARENAKSNIQRTRAERYLAIAKTPQGTLPAAYRYYGAGTGRLSSADGLGIMNLPSLRISRMREALKAPPGHVVHVADSSAIELRVRLWLCGQHDVLQEMDAGRDLYKETAADVFQKPIDEVTKNERHIGKCLNLGAQFMMGWRRYKAYLAAGPLGAAPILLTDDEAMRSINTFRDRDPRLPRTWEKLAQFVPLMAQENCNFEWKGCRIMYQCVILPNGMPMDYSGLRPTEDGSWCYGVNGTIKYIHPGLLLENFCQSLARIIVLEQCMEIDRTLARCVMTTHDEGVFIAPEDGADERQAAIEAQMKIAPAWCSDLKLNAEGGWSYCYDAK